MRRLTELPGGSNLRATATKSALIYVSRLSRAALGFAISWLVASRLGPEDFGFFYLFLVTVIFGQTILGEGLDPGLVRYYAANARNAPSKASEVLSSALALRVGIGLPALAVGLLALAWIGPRGLDPAYSLPLGFGLVGSVCAAIWYFDLAVLQAMERFRSYSLLAPLVNLLIIIP